MERIKVGIAEDNNISAEILKAIINEDEELELVGCVENGREACALVDECRPDVLLLDLIMPVMDGIMVLEELHKKRKAQEYCPYIIVLTSVGNDRVTAEAFKDGADYFIRKPYEKELILNRIKHYKEDKESEPALEKRIEDVLHEFGVTSNLKGYRYLKDAVMLCVKDDSRINYITKTIYPDIADRYGTTVECVERAMRHAIKLVWDKNGDESRVVCGHRILFDKSRPTNSEFIAQLTVICMQTEVNQA